MIEAGEVSPQRSAIMRAVKGKDTRPEMAVRRALHAMGYRFRVHRKDLAGRPDIVLPRHRVAIFVNGCFWHRHVGCRKGSMPKTRKDYWRAKFEANVARDAEALRILNENGWRCITVWECETAKPDTLSRQLLDALTGNRAAEAS